MLEADCLHYYSVDLPKEFYIISWRRFVVLVSGLPQDSTFLNAVFNKKETDPEILENEGDTPEMFAMYLGNRF